MRSGALKSRVIVSRLEKVKDPQTGAESDTLIEVAYRRAKIEPDTGGRQTNIDAQIEIYDAQITLRVDSATRTMQTGWFITDRFTGNQYKIEYVPPLDSRMKMFTVRGNYVSK